MTEHYDEDKLRAELSRDEGRIPHAYTDSLGYLTIGVGHLIDKRKGGRLSEHIIDLLLDEDITEAVADLDRKLPWWRTLTDARQRVLINLTFQLGIDGLLKFRATLAALQGGDYHTAAAQLRKSLLYRQTPERTERRAKLLESG